WGGGGAARVRVRARADRGGREEDPGADRRARGQAGGHAGREGGRAAPGGGGVPGLPAVVTEDLAAVADSLARLAAVNWQFDPTLVRGLGYYTGQVFEVVH